MLTAGTIQGNGGTPEATETASKTPQIIDIESGYTGGEERYANYQDHKYHGHREAVRITYDPEQTSFKQLVRYFFTKHDPTDANFGVDEQASGAEHAPEKRPCLQKKDPL